MTAESVHSLFAITAKLFIQSVANIFVPEKQQHRMFQQQHHLGQQQRQRVRPRLIQQHPQQHHGLAQRQQLL